MKNVMKNILLLCCLMGTASTLVAMHHAPVLTSRTMRNINLIDRKEAKKPKSSQVSLPSIESKISRTAGAVKTQSVAPAPLESDYERFLKACNRGDFDALKTFLISPSITAAHMTYAYHTVSNVHVKNFLFLAHNFLFTDSVQVLENIFTAHRKTMYRFLFFRFIPRRFETAVVNGHIEIMEHLLKKYSELVSNQLLKQMLSNVMVWLSNMETQKASVLEPAKNTYTRIQTILEQEIAQRRILEDKNAQIRHEQEQARLAEEEAQREQAEIDAEREEQFKKIVKLFDDKRDATIDTERKKQFDKLMEKMETTKLTKKAKLKPIKRARVKVARA